MNTDSLAINGGPKSVVDLLQPYNSLAEEERDAVLRVLDNGTLSGFVASQDEGFGGGQEIQQLESECCALFGTSNCIAVNSWTSGLICAVGSLGLDPGDEIILPPWTMSATAAAVLHWGCIPVFCDIDPLTFCLDPSLAEDLITPRTKAILTVDIFGLSSDIRALLSLCKRYNLTLISDTAQAPFATYHGDFAGTVSHIGGISLNRHKHIQTGEGGLIFTNDPSLARRMRLIRNHAEVTLDPSRDTLPSMIGYNFRLCEIEAAIAREQIKKLPRIVKERQNMADQLSHSLASLPGLTTPYVPNGLTHSYYVYGMTLDLSLLTRSRSEIVSALRAEGVPLASGYQNIHCLPVFQQRVAFGRSGFPWSIRNDLSRLNYGPGTCPRAEQLHNNTFIGIGFFNHNLSVRHIEQFSTSFHKVWREFSLSS